MSEEEKFLARWSRRKRAAEPQAETSPEVKPEDAPTLEPKEGEAKVATEAEGATAEQGEAKFDLSSLPSIELITAETDIRPFLRAGVPADLTRAALRRAWLADPAIRDYIGLSENAWDFTAPGGVPGFDLAEPTAEVRRVAIEWLGNKLESPAAEVAEPIASEQAPADPVPTPTHHQELKPQHVDSVADEQERDVAAQQETGSEPPAIPSARRRHGGALPG